MVAGRFTFGVNGRFCGLSGPFVLEERSILGRAAVSPGQGEKAD